jgi:hypothetical protein
LLTTRVVDLAPPEVGLNVTVNVAELFGGIGDAGLKAPTLNIAASPPDGAIPLTDRLDVPVFCMVNVCVTGVPITVDPKSLSLPAVAVLAVDPSAIFCPPPCTLISGASTVTVCVQVALLLLPSVAVHNRVVTPIG